MAVRRFPIEAPVRVALIDRVALTVARQWLQWFQNVSARYQRLLILDVAYDPPNLGAGATVTSDVSFTGVVSGDFVTGVSFSPMTVGGVPTSFIRLIANVKQDGVVSVTLINVGPGAIDLDAGTLRIQVERAI